MTDALEQELRAALAERASAMPDAADALARLRQTDFHSAPAASRSGWRPAWLPLWPALGGAAATVGAAIATAVVLLSSGATPAYAGWTPVPTAPSPADLALASAVCAQGSGPLARTAMAGKLVLGDERGRYIAELYVQGIDTGVCISAGHGRDTSVGGNAMVLGFYAAPGPDHLGIPGGGGGSAPGFVGGSGASATETHLYGLAGSDVAGVEFVFGDGSTVDATVESGWYFAWWPNQNQPTSVRVTMRSGATATSPMPSASCRPGVGACSLFAGFQPRSPGMPLISATGAEPSSTATATATTTGPSATSTMPAVTATSATGAATATTTTGAATATTTTSIATTSASTTTQATGDH